MSEAEMKRLKVGDKVMFVHPSERENKYTGTVKRLITHGVIIDYDDGMLDQGLEFDDGEFLQRFAL